MIATHGHELHLKVFKLIYLANIIELDSMNCSSNKKIR